jgi:hypothetical protein
MTLTGGAELVAINEAFVIQLTQKFQPSFPLKGDFI